ncbi:hypothetical protein F503_07131 [Ophiostoma piceae UAMH 11346]|uniref:2EXR domain-containing protein n=1 Tax=Ophiostoma piceae (strain UAMH 11346) TaxID=1262450 RepID=S3D7H2_OPHP1|nr:hypothetical protein F503_07131 [Ophiostoma piceae UAMH 11346]
MASTERPAKRRRVSDRTATKEGNVAPAPVYKTLRSGRRIGVKNRGALAAEPTGPTFHSFQKLPVELRMYIWQLAAESAMEPYHPLRVRIYKGFEAVPASESSDGRKRKTVLRLAAMPDLHRITRARRSLIQVCREANNEVRRLWNSSLSLHKGRTLYFSHTYDIIFLDIHEQTIIPDLFRLKRMGQLPSFTTDIGHVAFDMVPNYPLWMTGQEDMHPSIRLLFCFPRLHSVSLVHYKAFSPEIKWHLKTDVRWLLKRSTRHGVKFRSFQALDNFDYGQKCAVGNRQSSPYIRHECAICTIHKCAYILSLLRNKPTSGHSRHPPLKPDQIAFLGRLRRFMLLAATPAMTDSVPAYNHHSAGWWNHRAVLSGNILEEDDFANESEDDEAGEHVHGGDSSDEEDELGMDGMGGMGAIDDDDDDGMGDMGDMDGMDDMDDDDEDGGGGAAGMAALPIYNFDAFTSDMDDDEEAGDSQWSL